MIQRIQTVYLLLAVVLLVVCASLPIGVFYPVGMDCEKSIYNIAIIDIATNHWSFMTVPLIFLLAITTVLTIKNIFQYNNRKRQIVYCKICMWLIIGWYVAYGLIVSVLCPENYYFKWNDLSILPAILPAISLLFIWLAKRGIVHDENLIRSVDRIR